VIVGYYRQQVVVLQWQNG